VPVREESWIDPSTCAICGRQRAKITRHHEKNKDGVRTGRFVYVCRDCHDDEEGIVERQLVRKIAYHKRTCQECKDDWNKMLSHLKGLKIDQDGNVVETDNYQRESVSDTLDSNSHPTPST